MTFRQSYMIDEVGYGSKKVILGRTIVNNLLIFVAHIKLNSFVHLL